MKGRLFWKIFAAFVLTFLAQAGALWLMFTFFPPSRPAVAREATRPVEADLVDVATALIHDGGAAGLGRKLSGHPPSSLRIRPIESGDALQAPAGARIATAPDGSRYLIEYLGPPSQVDGPTILRAQLYINTAVVVSGLLFATFLAFYLSRPISSLRRGLEAFASGDFRTRVGSTVGTRRDEIADLARDFDAMADRIEQLVRAREQLIDDVSHELRSPLTRLQLAIALARQRPERTASALDRIQHEASRLDQLVGELLALSRLESGVADDLQYVDFSEMLNKLAADARFESSATAVQVTVIVQGEAGQAEFRGDSELLRRALENIIRNAVRHSPAEGTISIGLLQDADRIRIRIEDEGPGVAVETLPSLFEPFMRGQHGGFGLGLAIAQRAVVAHGGRITAELRQPHGLRVDLALPRSGLQRPQVT